MTRGKQRTPEFGARMEIGHHRVLPESFRLHKLAELWEQAFPTMNAFEKDGIHPKEDFALYLIGNAMVEMDRIYPEFSQTRVNMPILIVLADGWNQLENSQDRVELYLQIKAELLDTTTVGELKRKHPKWWESFYHFCARGP